MEKEMWTITDLLRKGYFESERAVRKAVRERRWPKPRKPGLRLLWEPHRVRAWVEGGCVRWIERSSKPGAF